MNFFELFQIEPKIDVDQTVLRKKYLDLNRALHPDVNEIPADDAIAMVNKAYTALKSRSSAIAHLFEIFGIDPSQGKLPPNFLMEMMMLNEQLEDSNKREATLKAIQDLEESIQEEEDKLVQAFDGVTSTKETLEVDKTEKLKELATVINKKQYLLRIKDNLNSFASA